MFPEGEILGVKIWRPLLPYTKDYIYEFAHKYVHFISLSSPS